jgi:hypothetical protein
LKKRGRVGVAICLRFNEREFGLLVGLQRVEQANPGTSPCRMSTSKRLTGTKMPKRASASLNSVSSPTHSSRTPLGKRTFFATCPCASSTALPKSRPPVAHDDSTLLSNFI